MNQHTTLWLKLGGAVVELSCKLMILSNLVEQIDQMNLNWQRLQRWR